MIIFDSWVLFIQRMHYLQVESLLLLKLERANRTVLKSRSSTKQTKATRPWLNNELISLHHHCAWRTKSRSVVKPGHLLIILGCW